MCTRRLASILVVAAACGGGNPGNPPGGDGGVGPPDMTAPGPYTDFPADPIRDGNAPANAAMLFADAGTQSGGPCMVEPEAGSLFPRNWLRLRFTLQPVGGQNLFEIRLHAANQVNDLVVYTTNAQYTLPADLWGKLTSHVVDQPITVTVRGAPFDGTNLTSPPALGTQGSLTIAPVAAAGAIVYWTTSGGTGFRGFSIGDESVRAILTPTQGGTACVGCHSSTPDGTYVGFSASDNAGNGDPARIALRTVDGQGSDAPFLTASARTLLGRTYQEAPVFSSAHWSTGDRLVLTMLQGSEMIWTDLEATATDEGTGWGVVQHTGDLGHAASATFSHDGGKILYASSASAPGAGVTVTDGDLYTVPWNARAGGAATKVAGASDGAFNEYYPIFSPDDQLIAYDRVAQGESSYNNPNAEVFVVGATDGVATRLAANDPPACGGKQSPGITNSWPKWSPEVATATIVNGGKSGTRSYYWITFSSTRGSGGNPQLYVAPIVRQESETAGVTSFPALYLWNQPPAENNHTPAWDRFQIPVQ